MVKRERRVLTTPASIAKEVSTKWRLLDEMEFTEGVSYEVTEKEGDKLRKSCILYRPLAGIKNLPASVPVGRF